MYTDIGSGVYGYRVRCIRIQGQIHTDIGSYQYGYRVRCGGAGCQYRNPCRERLRFQRLKLYYDEALSLFDFKCNLRRYTVDAVAKKENMLKLVQCMLVGPVTVVFTHSVPSTVARPCMV